jgi:hypothetical protein
MEWNIWYLEPEDLKKPISEIEFQIIDRLILGLIEGEI